LVRPWLKGIAREPPDEADRGRHTGFARHEGLAGGPGNLSLSFAGLAEEVAMREAQMRFLNALLAATRQRLIGWSVAEDDDRNIYNATIGNDSVMVEFVSVPTGGTSGERMLARVSGMGVYFQAALGTEMYDIIEEMLSLQIFGWSEGRSSGLRSLAKATARIEQLGPSSK